MMKLNYHSFYYILIHKLPKYHKYINRQEIKKVGSIHQGGSKSQLLAMTMSPKQRVS